jgi:hypothetical protein
MKWKWSAYIGSWWVPWQELALIYVCVVLRFRHPMSFCWNQPLLQEYLSKGELFFFYDVLLGEKLWVICKPFICIPCAQYWRCKTAQQFSRYYLSKSSASVFTILSTSAVGKNRVRQTERRTFAIQMGFFSHYDSSSRTGLLGFNSWERLDICFTPPHSHLFRDQLVDSIRILYDNKRKNCVTIGDIGEHSF